MNIGVSKLIEDAESFADQRRLLLAAQTLEEARRLSQIPDRRAFISYNLGAIYWHHLGNGVAARREFLACIAAFDAQGYGQHPQLRTVHANALENAMLCALSFEEFDSLAGQLNNLTPGIPILTGLVPEVRDWRERGDAWSDRLFVLAATYYNRNDPRQDVGRYGCAKSTYHLILAHRRELRVSRENWRMALFEYCALSMRMASDCVKARGGDTDLNSPEEFLPILTEALPLVEEYLQWNSGDDGLKRTCSDMVEMVNNCRQRWSAIKERSGIMPQKTDYQVCQKCGTVFSRRDMDGPGFMVDMMDIYDHSTMCPKCGGDVKWQSSPEIQPRLGSGWLPVLIMFGLLFIGLLILIYWVR